jgi:hypothetical protein
VLLVPYCTRCFLSAEREGTRHFAALLSSVVLAITLLLTLPRLLPGLGVFAYTALSSSGALIPAVVGLVIVGLPKPGQVSGGRAVWWAASGVLACLYQTWAKDLAGRNEAKCRAGKVLGPLPWPLSTGPVLALSMAPLSYSFQFPEVVLLNLGAEPFVVVADGARVARVPVTSLESPSSGVRVRLAAGKREVRLLSESGSELSRESLAVSAGRVHLYAPLSEGTCFWLEHDAYGRAEPPQARYRPLPASEHFWTLPNDVDNWFRENPDASSDHRSSGGTLLSLRHARCQDAPADAR